MFIPNYTLKSLWKEAVVAYFNAKFQYLPHRRSKIMKTNQHKVRFEADDF
jgi:hypothetical protein